MPPTGPGTTHYYLAAEAKAHDAIEAHPGVRSCAFIGLPDDDLGQLVNAIVDVPDLDPAAYHAFVPRSFEFVAEPLRDDAGKVRRSALRDARLPRSQES